MSNPTRIKPKFHVEQFNLPLDGYPNTPGYKNKDKDGPSRLAANGIKTRAPSLREKWLRAISQIPKTRWLMWWRNPFCQSGLALPSFQSLGGLRILDNGEQMKAGKPLLCGRWYYEGNQV